MRTLGQVLGDVLGRCALQLSVPGEVHASDEARQRWLDEFSREWHARAYAESAIWPFEPEAELPAAEPSHECKWDVSSTPECVFNEIMAGRAWA